MEGEGQVRRINDHTYEIRFQTWSGRTYEVIHTEHGWLCECPDGIGGGNHCKHAHAVEMSRRMREAVQETGTMREVNLGRCKRYGSPNIHKDGIRCLKKGDVQQYGCKDCGRRFTSNLGFERKRFTPEQISTAVDLVFAGTSTRKTAKALKGTGVTVSHMMVTDWAAQYANIMESYMDKIRPQVGESWRTGEAYMSIRGNRRYLFAMLDRETRYWIAKQVAEPKGNDDVAPVFKQARQIAGKVPATLISDKAANFHYAWKQQYRAKNFLHKDTVRINDVAFDGIRHNNRMGSFNGATLCNRKKVRRGLKREGSDNHRTSIVS